ncbi:MAG: hypothetical protein OEV64_10195, partial [Desulfobulbaceae bacterium]|nr:hypothetical protein [Desulfobulbaceae bacterium]
KFVTMDDGQIFRFVNWEDARRLTRSGVLAVMPDVHCRLALIALVEIVVRRLVALLQAKGILKAQEEIFFFEILFDL